jgi:hypothetical protein
MCAVVCARVHVFLQFCIFARVCVERLCGHSWHGGTGGIYSSACGARTAVCAFFVRCIGRFARVHAGATWTSRTTSAPWAARHLHTTVVDAAGAIYVIGGYSSGVGGSGATWFQDVWATTDGGADRTRAGWLGSTGWVGRGTKGVLRGTTGVLGYSRATPGVLQGYSWGK